MNLMPTTAPPSGPARPWRADAPTAPASLLPFLLEPGSLTDRLIATGARFTVTPLKLGVDTADHQEGAALGIGAGESVLARHVALSLDDAVVVVARSVCRPDCSTWAGVLDRGGRSLGLSLFAPDSPVSRGPLYFSLLNRNHALGQLADTFEPSQASYPARCCRFSQNGDPLLVTEAFLLALERFTP